MDAAAKLGPIAPTVSLVKLTEPLADEGRDGVRGGRGILHRALSGTSA